MDNYIFTETKCDINRAQSLPLDDILQLGNNIWNDVKTHPDIKDEKKSEELYYKIFNKYKDFGTSFPIILRWMVQMRRYSEKAFKKFLIKYSTANIESKKDFLILQADYVVYLYEENKHYDKKHVQTYRDFIIKQLLEEEDRIKAIQEELNKELDSIDYEKRKRIYDYIKESMKNN